MTFHHVLLELKSAPGKMQCVMADLSEQDLTEKFLKPYRKGLDIVCGNGGVPVSQIRKLHIIRTARNSAAELQELRERIAVEIEKFNIQTDTVRLVNVGKGNKPEDIIEAGEDETSIMLSGPLGRE